MKFKPLFIVSILVLSIFGTSLIHAETAEFYFNLGRENFDNCNYHLAIENYNHALRLKPDYAEAFNGRGEIYLNVREYTDADREFSSAIMANPQYEIAFINRGRLYRIFGDYSRAIADWTTALGLNPNLAKLREELAELYLCQGTNKSEIKDIAGAIRNLSLACFYDPENAEAWYRLGALFLYVGSFAEAEACFLEVQNIQKKTHNQEHFIALLEKKADVFRTNTVYGG